MGTEIERKFLVIKERAEFLSQPGEFYSQGYLNSRKERTVRVRIAGERSWITIKGMNRGYSRPEFEYPIPLDDAEKMLALCEVPIITKFRRMVIHQGRTWQVDEFTGENEGLILAEIELESEDQDFPLPPWLGEEVSHDPRYFNSNLVQYPYSFWKPG